MNGEVDAESDAIAYNILKKALTDSSFVQAFIGNPDLVIQKDGITDPNKALELKEILQFLINASTQTQDVQKEMEKLNLEGQKAMQKFVVSQLETTMKTADEFKKGLTDTIHQIESGYSSVMKMYKMSFYLGIILIVFSLILAIWKEESLLPIVFGGLGIIDVIAYFITKPPQDLQNSRANLAQLQAAYFNWFIDVFNWNSFLGTLSQTGQLSFKNVKDVSDTLLQNTDKTMEMMEKYCELSKK